MPNGFQWTPEDVHNAERLAEIQARANAKAYREVQEQLDKDREEAEWKRECQEVRTSRPLPKSLYLHDHIDVDLLIFNFGLAEIKRMPENTAEEVLAKLKATASYFAEYYNKAEQEHLRAHKLPEGKYIGVFTKPAGRDRVQKKVNSEAMVSINKYGVTADAVRKAWKAYYDFKEQYNL